jgi:hypothetical protein
MKILKLEDGMELKIVPIIRKDGSHSITIPISCLYYEEHKNSSNFKKVVYDEGNYIIRLYNHSKINNYKINYSSKNVILTWHEGELKMMFVSKSILTIIINEFQNTYNFTENRHLKIVQELVNSPIGPLPDYKKSHFIDKDWIKPTEGKDEWVKILKNNDIDDFLKENGVLANLSSLNKEFNNFFSDLISEGRNKKLEELGIS